MNVFKIVYFTVSLFHIFIIIVLFIILDIYNSLIFSSVGMVIWLTMILYSYFNKNTVSYLSQVMGVSNKNSVESTFINSVNLLEKFGNIAFIASGISYIIGLKYYYLIAIIFVLIYFCYLFLWALYFKKYHISFQIR